MLLRYSLLLIPAVISVSLPLSLANLTGILSQSTESPELITVVIINQGPRQVALLKHNTLFDTSHLSMPCRVTDGNGRRVPMLASHVMYNGISEDNLLDLAPGNNFTRVINMTEYLVHDGPDHAQFSKPITISLPSTVQGREDDEGHHKLHPDAPGHISGSQARVADFSKASLSYLPLRSNSLQVTMTIRNNPSLLKRELPQFNGMMIASKDCTPAQHQNYSNAILHVGYLAVAASNAAATFEALPFNYFLPATAEAANKVGQAMSKLRLASQRQGPRVLGTCVDLLKNCGVGNLGYAMFVAGGHPSYVPRVVLCPAALTLPDITIPCRGRPGEVTTAYVLLHELAHIDEISGIRATDWPRPHNYQSARSVHTDLLAGKDTTTDAVALGMLGSWSWELGLGPWGGRPCMDKFYQGDFDSLHRADGRTFSG